MRRVIGHLVILAILSALAGCAEDKIVGAGKENQSPQVWLSSAPPEGTVSNYTLHLFWGGWDPDGDIAYYQYAITDNNGGAFNPADTTGADKWHRVYSNDSTFTFTADTLADSSTTDSNDLVPVDFVRTHTFFIRAVDKEGLASAKPAYRSFTARTLSPIVDILVPLKVGENPAEVPPISTFSWLGKDFVSSEIEVQDPDSVRWILVSAAKFEGSWNATMEYIRKNPDAPEWSAWHYYGAPGDSGRSWTTPPLDFGPYVFGVQVKDEAGAISPVFDEDRNLRRVRVSQRLTGPVLSVTNKYMGTIITSSPNTPPTIVDLPASVPMQFRFTANASTYGGVASGYRYGWDIQDLGDPTEWEIDYTPFVTVTNGIASAESPSRTWQFDSHTFYIEVIDNSGYASRAAVTLNIVPFSMQKNILLIDDYDEAPNAGFAITAGGSPSDGEHDAFWVDMLAGWVDTATNDTLPGVKGFDPVADMIEVEDNLPIQAVADYKTVIWDTYCGYNAKTGISLLPEIIRFVPTDPALAGGVSGKVKLNILALYMAAGGHVLLCGEQPMTAVINPTVLGTAKTLVFPLIFRYELTGDQKSPYEDSKVGEEGVGDNSFSYAECCLNVLDISVITNRRLVRGPLNSTCFVTTIREHNLRTDGLRFATAAQDPSDFPLLELRPEVSDPGRVFAPERQGLVNDLYNPPYFQLVCDRVAETNPPRPCFQPIYTHGCLNTSSKIYGAPIAFWTGTFADRVPDGGGVAARSVVWGFEPVFFKPAQVKQAMDIILFDEWKLPRASN